MEILLYGHKVNKLTPGLIRPPAIWETRACCWKQEGSWTAWTHMMPQLRDQQLSEEEYVRVAVCVVFTCVEGEAHFHTTFLWRRWNQGYRPDVGLSPYEYQQLTPLPFPHCKVHGLTLERLHPVTLAIFHLFEFKSNLFLSRVSWSHFDLCVFV